jgi:hypothetical protein
VPDENLETGGSVAEYLLGVQKTAKTRFPQTFMN